MAPSQTASHSPKFAMLSRERIRNRLVLWGKIAPGVLLLLSFISFFLLLAIEISKTGIFTSPVNFFELDFGRVIGDLTSISGDHYRTKVHPIFVLMFGLFGSAMKQATGDAGLSAVLLTNFVGAAGVLLSYVVFIMLCHDRLNAFLLACLYGVTNASIFFSVIPETSSFASCSLIFTYALFLWSLRERTIRQPLWILAGILTLGITITNFAQTFICYLIVCCSIYDFKKNPKKLVDVPIFAGCTLLITGLLALLQKAIFPSSNLFFLPSSFAEEHLYASIRIFSDPLPVIGELLQNFFIINISAPNPVVVANPNGGYSLINFSGLLRYAPLGWVSLILWLLLLLAGIYSIFFTRENQLFYKGVAFCLLFNFLLHCFYGVYDNQIEYFVYAGNFSFLAFCLVGNLGKLRFFSFRCILIIEIALLAFTNVTFLTKITGIAGEESGSLLTSEQNLSLLRKQAGDIAHLPSSDYFLFGMGPRQKLVYQDGQLIDLQNGSVVKTWQLSHETIIRQSIGLNLSPGRVLT